MSSVAQKDFRCCSCKRLLYKYNQIIDIGELIKFNSKLREFIIEVKCIKCKHMNRVSLELLLFADIV